MDNIEKIQTIIDNNKKNLNNDNEYNEICNLMKGLYEEKEEKAVFVEVQYLDLFIYPHEEGRSVEIYLCCKIAITKMDKKRYEMYKTNTLIRITCHELNYCCNCDMFSRDGRSYSVTDGHNIEKIKLYE
jgi:hypothetical protein